MRSHSLSKLLALLAVVLLLSTPYIPSGSAALAPPYQPLEGSFVPDEILIGLQPGYAQVTAGFELSTQNTGVKNLDWLNHKYAVRKISPLFDRPAGDGLEASREGLAGVYRLTVPPGTDLFAMIAEYQNDPAIAYAEVNSIFELTDIPNDSQFGSQWALHNTGQTGGRPDADIDAPEAWDIEKGKPSIVIAIIDTGVDYNHPDLVGKVLTDIGRDFVNDDNDAMDDHGHGTYTAGIAAAASNNALGIAGVCRGCKILPVKVLNTDGAGTAASVAQGIQYAGQVGADVISMSLGYTSTCGCSQTVARAINYSFESGSLLVAASGNDGDKASLSYPAASPRVMSVGASDHKDQEADFSNRSPFLDIYAPGKDIYSLDRNGSYRNASGTSAAAPHVAGVAGLIWSARPFLNSAQVWSILSQSAEDLPGQTAASAERTGWASNPAGPSSGAMMAQIYLPVITKMRASAGRLNAYRALTTYGAGHALAPPDQCSTEPDCPPGCGAEVALSGQEQARSDLRVLRDFRDGVLAPTAIGQHWIELYQANRLEAAAILVKDTDFRADTRAALKLWLPLFRSLAYPNSVAPGQAHITRQHAETLEDIMAGMMARGSPRLVSATEQVQATLDIRRFVGWDMRAAWNELQDQP